jgi:gas vesicle protein
MIARTRTAMKFFTYGLLIGLLFAPRSGKETRSRILAWASDSVKSLIGG